MIEAFAQNNGHLALTDARYVNALKLFLQGVTPLEYAAHRGFAYLGPPPRRAPAPRFAALMQSIDELRHTQTEIHTISHYNKYFNGMHDFERCTTGSGTCRCRSRSSKTPSRPARSSS